MYWMRSMGPSPRLFNNQAKVNTKDARSSTALYRFPGCQWGDQKYSVPTFDRNVSSELFSKQLTSKSFKCRSLPKSSILSGLMSLCNTPALCKPVTACKHRGVFFYCITVTGNIVVANNQEPAKGKLQAPSMHANDWLISVYLKGTAPVMMQQGYRD